MRLPARHPDHEQATHATVIDLTSNKQNTCTDSPSKQSTSNNKYTYKDNSMQSVAFSAQGKCGGVVPVTMPGNRKPGRPSHAEKQQKEAVGEALHGLAGFINSGENFVRIQRAIKLMEECPEKSTRSWSCWRAQKGAPSRRDPRAFPRQVLQVLEARASIPRIIHPEPPQWQAPDQVAALHHESAETCRIREAGLLRD